MPKIGQWKKILGNTEKPKTRVQVSGKAEAMTDTQSIRFEELTKRRDAGTPAADRNPLAESKYGLEDASFRLIITEDQLLHKAATGSISLFVDAVGPMAAQRYSGRNPAVPRAGVEVGPLGS
jgi:hypothetical protein